MSGGGPFASAFAASKGGGFFLRGALLSEANTVWMFVEPSLLTVTRAYGPSSPTESIKTVTGEMAVFTPDI